jgi:hypothetical protein
MGRELTGCLVSGCGEEIEHSIQHDGLNLNVSERAGLGLCEHFAP